MTAHANDKQIVQRRIGFGALRRVGQPTFLQATVATIVVILVLGALRLFDPFSGDQALFLVAAEKLHAGGVLYRDFWDIKQPGIFAFFLGGGLLSGFTQFGLHEVDLIWELVFSIVLVLGLRESFEDRRWAAFAPLAIVGAYFTGSSSWHLLQVEGLVGLPLFCTTWFAIAALKSVRHRRTLAGLSGAAAGVAILFKLLFAGVVVATAFAIGAFAFRQDRRIPVLELAAGWCVGVLIPLAAFGSYVVHFGLLHEVVTTFFVLPLSISASPVHAPTSRLVDSALRFALYFRGIIFLAIIGIVLVRDGCTRLWRLGSVVWLVSAAVTILVQEESWWQYQFLLLLPPMGILATFGTAALAGRVWTTGRRGFAWLALCGVAAYIAVPLPQAGIDTARRIFGERPYASPTALERYRAASSVEYAQAERDAAFLKHANNDARDIYVFGNPLIYVLTGRGQALGINGWALHLYTPKVWERLNVQLLAAAPPYVFVLQGYDKGLIPDRSPRTAALLVTNYAAIQATSDGTWFRHRNKVEP